MSDNDGEVRIRNADLYDAREIFKIIQENTDKLVPRSVSDIVQHIDRFLVAECGDAVVGVIAFEIFPEIGLPLKSCIELQSVCVREKYRMRGVGRMLVEAQIARLKPLKPYQIVVLTYADGFFGRLGFREVPKASLMHKLYIGCINCTKHESPYTCPEKAMALFCEQGSGRTGNA